MKSHICIFNYTKCAGCPGSLLDSGKSLSDASGLHYGNEKKNGHVEQQHK